MGPSHRDLEHQVESLGHRSGALGSHGRVKSRGGAESVLGAEQPLWGRVGNRVKERDWGLEARRGVQEGYGDGGEGTRQRDPSGEKYGACGPMAWAG